MSVYRLCRARGWTRQEPGRVDRMVRRLAPRLCRLHTVSLEDAVDFLFGFQPGDTITFKVQGLFDEGAPYSSPSAPQWRDIFPTPRAPFSADAIRKAAWAAPPPIAVTEDGDKFRYTLRGEFAGASPRGWRDVRLTFAGVDVTPHVKAVNLKPPLPPWLGYAWPPAGDERRPPQWPGGGHNKSDDNKDNRSKNMARNAAGTIRPADLDDRVQVGADNIRDATPAEVIARAHPGARERLVVDNVHLLASRFLTGIREAEDLGLEVRVEQVYARQNNNEWHRTPARTEQLRVGVTKMVG